MVLKLPSKYSAGNPLISSPTWCYNTLLNLLDKLFYSKDEEEMNKNNSHKENTNKKSKFLKEKPKLGKTFYFFSYTQLTLHPSK